MTVAKHAEHAECQNMLLDPRNNLGLTAATASLAYDNAVLFPTLHVFLREQKWICCAAVVLAWFCCNACRCMFYGLHARWCTMLGWCCRCLVLVVVVVAWRQTHSRFGLSKYTHTPWHCVHHFGESEKDPCSPLPVQQMKLCKSQTLHNVYEDNMTQNQQNSQINHSWGCRLMMSGVASCLFTWTKWCTTFLWGLHRAACHTAKCPCWDNSVDGASKSISKETASLMPALQGKTWSNMCCRLIHLGTCHLNSQCLFPFWFSGLNHVEINVNNKVQKPVSNYLFLLSIAATFGCLLCSLQSPWTRKTNKVSKGDNFCTSQSLCPKTKFSEQSKCKQILQSARMKKENRNIFKAHSCLGTINSFRFGGVFSHICARASLQLTTKNILVLGWKYVCALLDASRDQRSKSARALVRNESDSEISGPGHLCVCVCVCVCVLLFDHTASYATFFLILQDARRSYCERFVRVVDRPSQEFFGPFGAEMCHQMVVGLQLSGNGGTTCFLEVLFTQRWFSWLHPHGRTRHQLRAFVCVIAWESSETHRWNPKPILPKQLNKFWSSDWSKLFQAGVAGFTESNRWIIQICLFRPISRMKTDLRSSKCNKIRNRCRYFCASRHQMESPRTKCIAK